MLSKIKSLILNDGTFLLISTVLVNAGNYAINLLLGRFLGPEAFAEVSVIATGVLMLSFLAVGLQLTTAKYSATYFAEKKNEKLHAFIAWITKRSWILSSLLAALLILSMFHLQIFFHFKSAWSFLIIALGIPFYFAFSISRGWFQGICYFKKLAYTYLIEMVVRLIVTFGLIAYILHTNAQWSTEAIALGFLASFLITYAYSRRKKIISFGDSIKNELPIIKNFILIIIGYEFSQILINNSDIMLVKHYFGNHDAGIYSALALIGRVVFFATWTIVTLLFPKVIQAEKKGEKHSHLFWGALGIVFSIGVIITGLCYGLGENIIQILFGNEYTSASSLLWKYATATTLFACANVFAYYFMSLDKYGPVFISLVIGLLQIISICFFHATLGQVIYVQIYLMSLLFISMTLYYFYHSATKRHNVFYSPNIEPFN